MNAINKENIEKVNSLIASGATKDRIEGYLLFEGVAKKDAIAYLKEIGLLGAVTFRGWLHSSAKKGYISPEEFSTKIAGESLNVRNHYREYNTERKLANSIHAKYSSDIESLVANESDRGNEKPGRADSTGAPSDRSDKPSFKEPSKPKTTKGLYKKLVQGCHPDRNRNGWAEEFTKQVNNAQDDKYNLDILWDEYVELLRKEHEEA